MNNINGYVPLDMNKEEVEDIILITQTGTVTRYYCLNLKIPLITVVKDPLKFLFQNKYFSMMSINKPGFDDLLNRLPDIFERSQDLNSLMILNDLLITLKLTHKKNRFKRLFDNCF